MRKSLKTSDRTSAIAKAEEEVLDLKVVLKNGGSVLPLSVEDLVEKFLQTKRALIRGKWEGKRTAVTQEHHQGEVCPDRRETSELPGAVPWCQVRCPQLPLSKWNQKASWRSETQPHPRLGARSHPKQTPQERDGNEGSAGGGDGERSICRSHQNSPFRTKTW